MKRTQTITLVALIAVLFLTPSLTNAQLVQQAVPLSAGTIQALPSSSISGLQADLHELDQEIAYLERLMMVYQYYGRESQAQAIAVELQNKLQQQARIMQTVSNILKVRHDTAMATIRNMR